MQARPAFDVCACGAVGERDPEGEAGERADPAVCFGLNSAARPLRVRLVACPPLQRPRVLPLSPPAFVCVRGGALRCACACADPFRVIPPARFTSEVLRNYLRTTNFASFVRQLNYYGTFDFFMCVRALSACFCCV